MNRKAIKWLYQELPELIVKGVLTQEVAGKIRQYYGEIKSTSRTSAILIISGTIGALLILFWKSPGFNPGMNGDFFKAGGSPGL